VVVTSRKGEMFKYVLQIQFPTPNNIVEYEALLLSMRISIVLIIHRI
jgi:hypothetical protein